MKTLQCLIGKWILYGLIGLAIALFWGAIAGYAVLAQDTSPAPTEEPPTVQPERAPGPSVNPVIRPLRNWSPPEVKDIFRDKEDAAIAPIYLDGRTLFEVAAPKDGDGTLTAEERADAIEEQLEEIARNFIRSANDQNLDVSVVMDEETNQPVIYVNGEMLMTVTFLDARIHGSNSLTLQAAQIADEVEAALTQFYDERQPDFLWQRARWAGFTLLIASLLSIAISFLARRLHTRRQDLQQQWQQSALTSSTAPAISTDAVRQMRSTLLTRQQVNGMRMLGQFLSVLQIALWISAFMIIVGFFPYTRWLQPLMVEVMRLPVRFGIIIAIAYILIRLSSIWIDRLLLAFQERTTINPERSQRLTLRLSTFSQVVKGLVAFLICGVAALIMLSFLGVRVAPLLAGAGLVGFAISFASQSLIRDIINGFLVLLEDQYGVGDVITVRDMSGFVEAMNLRITQLRATDGTLITIPNGQIDIVQNLSKEWSRVDLMIPVGLTANLDRALHLIEQEAEALRRDDIWGPLILEPPLLLGVDELSHAGAIIRIWIKTQPLKQWDVAREYRRRLKIAFEIAQIPLGVPQQIVQFSPEAPPTAPFRSNGGSSAPHSSSALSPDIEHIP